MKQTVDRRLGRLEERTAPGFKGHQAREIFERNGRPWLRLELDGGMTIELPHNGRDALPANAR